MKYLKRFNETFNDDEILKLMYSIEELNKELEEKSVEGSSSYINCNYDPKLDYITIDYGWSTYSEGGSDTWRIFYKENPIRVQMQDYGSTVYGNFDNNREKKFETFDDIFYELKSHFGL